MRFMLETVLLGFTGFVCIIVAIAMGMVIEQTTSHITASTGMLGVSSQVNPFMTMINNVFWVVSILSFVCIIILYLVGAHYEEKERYEYY